jgi:hypothetical protein
MLKVEDDNGVGFTSSDPCNNPVAGKQFQSVGFLAVLWVMIGGNDHQQVE